MGHSMMPTEMMGMMRECMKGCRICALVPMVLGIFLFALGYFLEAETVRALWLVFSAIPIVGGLLALLMMTAMNRA